MASEMETMMGSACSSGDGGVNHGESLAGILADWRIVDFQLPWWSLGAFKLVGLVVYKKLNQKLV